MNCLKTIDSKLGLILKRNGLPLYIFTKRSKYSTSIKFLHNRYYALYSFLQHFSARDNRSGHGNVLSIFRRTPKAYY